MTTEKVQAAANRAGGKRHQHRLRRVTELLGLCLIAAGWGPLSGLAETVPFNPSQTSYPRPAPAETPSSAVTVPTIQSLSLPRHFETDVSRIGKELEGFIKKALRDNPDLAAARAALASSQARVPQAGMPEDPKAAYRLKDMPTTFDFRRESATQQQYIVMQSYPFPGKLALREKVVGKEAEVTREQVHLATLHLITQVRSAFDDVFLIDKDIQLAFEQRRMLRDFAQIASDKYKVGPGLQQDILNADVAISSLDSTIIELARKRKTREIRLAVLLNQEAVDVPPLGRLPEASLKHTPLQLEQMAEEMNPEIRARQLAVERDEFRLDLARKAVLPDFFVEVDYGSRSDPVKEVLQRPRGWRPDLLRGMLGINLPIFYYYKQREQVVEAEADLARSRSQLEAVRQKTVAGLRDLLLRLAQYEQVALSYSQAVIPLAQTAVAAAMSAYQVDKVDFLTMLDAQEKLERYETAYWHNQAERYRTLAQIDEITGDVLVETGWSK